jgi:DNA-binding LacI/PurR family transcriptional regulator
MNDSIIFETENGKMEMVGDPLKNYIISRIKSGELKSGMPLLSTQKLSNRFGVSLITAQKVLKELGDENYLVRQRGKRTVVADTSLRKKEVVSEVAVGVLFTGIDDNPFHAMLLAALFNYGLKHNIRIVSHTHSTSDSSISDVELFLDKLKSNGIKYCIQNPQDLRQYRKIWMKTLDSGIKTVMLNDFWYGGGPLTCVKTHEERGHEMVFNHLLTLGHQQILLLDETRSQPRLYAEQALKQILRYCSLPFDENMVKYISDTRPSSCEFFSAELIKDIIDNYTAVYCTYDIYALKLCEVLTQAGIKVGKDISVVGFDNIPIAKSYGLTTVAHPIDKLVTNTFKQLFVEEQEQQCICLPPKLIIRNSTGQCLG